METPEPVTAAMLREFVLSIDLKLEQLRTEIRTEFGQVHAILARLETLAQAHERRLDRIDIRLDRMETRLDRMNTWLLGTVLTAGVALGTSVVALLR